MVSNRKVPVMALLAVATLLFASTVGAQSSSDETRSRPRIGLVLGGVALVQVGLDVLAEVLVLPLAELLRGRGGRAGEGQE